MIRDGYFDLVIAAGPRAEPWPSVGVRSLSSFCAKMGLTVGVFGGESISVKGVIPLQGAGALVLAQDIQGRIHRIHARSVVRVAATGLIADPFKGWDSPALVPLNTAKRLWKNHSVSWDPNTVILGSGNAALQFGCELLDSGVAEVICVETNPQRGAKRFSGWEVFRRRFEMAGGKLIEAQPLSLTRQAALLWELRLQDSHGIRVQEVTRVVMAGPFSDLPAIREYPPGSLLLELEQTAGATKEQDIDGWLLEEERGRWLACKIIKALGAQQESNREELESVLKKARSRLKRYQRHYQEPFTPAYEGKWVAAPDLRKIKECAGVPKAAHLNRPVASIECIESISCNICHLICPERAISVEHGLDEEKCTGCGVCVRVCPADAIVLLHQREEQSSSLLGLPWRGKRNWKHGELPVILNRHGEVLGSARVVRDKDSPPEPESPVTIVQLEVPSHLLWEARAIKRPKLSAAADEKYFAAVDDSQKQEGKVEITMNGEKRRVRDQVPIATALFELGLARPEDLLHCSDGSCGLCDVNVDGVKKLACQTKIHKGMAVQLPKRPESDPSDEFLCSCQSISAESVIARLQQGKLRSPEAVLSVTHVGEGKCRGQRCMDPFKRLLKEQGMDLSQWIDWRFPWSEWTLNRN